MTSPDLFRALAVVCEGASPDVARVAGSLGLPGSPGVSRGLPGSPGVSRGLPGSPDAAAHTDLFCLQLPPYASIHLGADGMLGGEAVLRGEARRALLWEHLLPWVPVYARAPPWPRLPGRRTGPGPRRSKRSSEPRPRSSPVPDGRATAFPSTSGRPLNRSCPAMVASTGSSAQMLVPVRSGMVVTRRDLAGAARGLGLGLRVGERRFILCALAAQDPVAICGWLAGEARAWADHHSRLVPALGPVAGFGRPGPRRPPSGCSNAGRTWSLSPTPAEGGGGY